MPTSSIQTKAKFAKNLTLVLVIGLMLSFMLWQSLRPTGFSIVLLAIQLVPLLIFLPALLKENPRAYIGLCFVILLYFVKGVEGVFHPARAWIDLATVSFSVTLFISSMMASRWLQFARIQQPE